MNYNIIVEHEAIQDLINIKKYIANDSITKANSFISELKGKIKSLDTMPHRCRKSLYTKESNTHDLIYKSYTIVYKVIDYNIHILTVFKQKNY